MRQAMAEWAVGRGPDGRCTTMAVMPRQSVGRMVAFVTAAAAFVALAPVALAHGVAPSPPADLIGLLGLWSFDPAVAIPLALAAVGWLAAVRRVDREHPSN